MTTAYTPDVISTHGSRRTNTKRLSASRQAAELDRTRHLLRHVERALLVQELAASSEEASDAQQARAAGPGENAGIIDIGQGWGIAFKIESHNHPSFIEPFRERQPALAAFCGTSSPWAHAAGVLDALRFGSLEDARAGSRNGRIVEGVVAGISHYGNCFGVPTIGGETVFERFNGNPLVNVFALGVVHKDKVYYGKAFGRAIR